MTGHWALFIIHRKFSVVRDFNCLLMVGLLCGASALDGHMPADQSFSAFQWPEWKVPVIDGDLSDWGSLGRDQAITTEMFTDLVSGQRGQAGDDDFSVILMVGWHRESNKLYVAAQIEDDIHQIDRLPGTAASQIFLDDDMEIFLDADHSGGQYANFVDLDPNDQLALNGSTASHFVLAGPPPDEDFLVNFSAASWYSLVDGPHTQAAYLVHEGVGKATLVTYEMMITPFDRVDMTADFLSREHVMRENEVIGFNVEFSDFDVHSGLFDAKYSLSGGYNSFQLSDRFTDLRLLPRDDFLQPTALTSQSWARIKASFASENGVY